MKQGPFIILLCSLVLICVSSCGQKQPKSNYDRSHFEKYPSFGEVVEAYFAANSLYLESQNYEYKFEKRQKGWFVVNYDAKDQQRVRSRKMFWSAANSSYIVEIPQVPTDIRVEDRKAVAGRRFFDQCPLCGYKNASKDLIELLEGAKDLKAEELECLARAYSRTASQTIVPRRSGQFFTKYDTTFNAKDISKGDLKHYKEQAKKAVETYDQLRKEYLDYETSSGGTVTRYSNEYLMHYYELEVMQQNQLKKQFIPKGLYEEPMLEIAKNYLRSCAQNAILFTWGNDDTYPLLYVQQMENFRKDVTIVNANLTNLGSYIHYLKEILPAEKKILTSLPIEKYKLNENDYIILLNNTKPVYLQDMLGDMVANPDRYINEDYTNVKKLVRFLPTRSVYLNKAKNPIQTTFQAAVLLKSDLFILDAIASNYGQRPICFSAVFPTYKLWDLGRYLQLDGYVYSLRGQEGESFRGNPVALKKHISGDFIYPKLNQRQTTEQEYQRYTTQNMLMNYRLGDYYYNNGKMDSLSLLVKETHDRFPIAEYNYEQFHIIFAVYCSKLSDKANAEQHLDWRAKRLETQLKAIEEDATRTQLGKDMEKQRLTQNINDLITATTNMELQTKAEEFHERFKPYLEVE